MLLGLLSLFWGILLFGIFIVVLVESDESVILGGLRGLVRKSGDFLLASRVGISLLGLGNLVGVS